MKIWLSYSDCSKTMNLSLNVYKKKFTYCDCIFSVTVMDDLLRLSCFLWRWELKSLGPRTDFKTYLWLCHMHVDRAFKARRRWNESGSSGSGSSAVFPGCLMGDNGGLIVTMWCGKTERKLMTEIISAGKNQLAAPSLSFFVPFLFVCLCFSFTVSPFSFSFPPLSFPFFHSLLLNPSSCLFPHLSILPSFSVTSPLVLFNVFWFLLSWLSQWSFCCIVVLNCLLISSFPCFFSPFSFSSSFWLFIGVEAKYLN